MSEVYSASAGGVPVLHALATSDTALTAREVMQRLDGANHDTVQSTLTTLLRSEYVTRSKRDTGGKGPNPYEYAVYQPAGDEL